MTTLTELEPSAVEATSVAAGEPDWLRSRRLDALARFRGQAWPDSAVDEFWRSTPFDRRFHLERPLVVDAGDDVAVPASVADELEAATVQVRMVDGTVTEATVPAPLAERGVVAMDLARAAVEHADLVERHLGRLTTSVAGGTGSDEDRTVTANDAAWTVGAFLHVPDEVEVDVPLSVHVHVATPGAHLPRVLAVIGRHARATIYLEHTSAPGVEAVVDEVAELFVLDGARLDLASLQDWEDGIEHLGLQKIEAHRDTTIRTLAVTTGGGTVRLRPECDLVGPGADVRPLGLYFAHDGQWFDLQPYVRHIAPRASSDVLFKGALQGRARTVFRGNVFVHRDAVGTATDENNRSLILTEGARADATPFLEIECSDITAGHGSATGQIDARHLFYLQARGIDRETALRLIVGGFFREVLDEIALPGVRERALAGIEAEIAATDLSTVQVNDAALREVVDR